MPVRIPAARTSEVLSFGVAGVGAFAPLYLLLAPGAEETLARQTARWAPRWERVAARYVAPPMQHAVHDVISPPVARAVQRADRLAQPRVSRAAQTLDRRIRSGLARVGV